MPKLKPSKEDRKNLEVKTIIDKYTAANRTNTKGVALKMHMPLRTYQQRRRYPGTFKLMEIRKLCEVLKIPDEEKALML